MTRAGASRRGEHRAHTLRRAALAASLVAVVAQAGTGCGSNKNYDQREAYAATLPNDDPPGCLGQCQVDPGSPLADCEGEEEGLEFLPIWTMERQNQSGNRVASSLYTYTDRSIHNLTPSGWEPPAIPMVRCGGDIQEWGLNLKGGPFRDWGGGMGTRLDWHLYGSGNCAQEDPEFRAEWCQPLDTAFPFDTYTFDLTGYEGISLWARRGPDSQPLLRVMIGDRRTDDDISFLMYAVDADAPRFCERNRVCGCEKSAKCLDAFGHEDNTEFQRLGLVPRPYLATEEDIPEPLLQDPIEVCWDADRGTPLPYAQWKYSYCGVYECNRPYEAFPDASIQTDVPDPQFNGRGCNSFAFRGGIVDNYCYNPGEDPDPFENDDLCGDHWAYPIRLTTEWQFYKIPFTRLLQQGWAKEQPVFDLHAVSMLRLTWDKGYVDFWLDDVSFYRKARPEEPEGAAGAGSE